MTETNPKPSLDFVRSAVEADNTSGRFGGNVVTRFPPEPNGYLHIGHAKSMCLNFGLAQEYGGRCHMRFDDTNPAKEEEEFVDGILEDVRWLGWDWGDNLYFASDHFDKLYDFAIDLINKGKAYVDDLDQEQIRKYRGTLTEPGVESPYSNRSIEENLALFQSMKNGEIDEGQRVLRAKIDMSSGNINMRDPVLYRVLKTPHHRTGDKWVVYPMYDFAHGQSDSVEGVTHSICTMEYEDHRPLYDWLLDALDVYHPQQIEFARLNMSHTVMSKRKLAQLVNEGHVSGWDDPRMPTLAGLRRRGYTPESIRRFCEMVGVAKRQNVIEIGLLEHAIRDDLNTRAARVLAVLRPLKVVIENYPEDQVEHLDAVNNPEDPDAGARKVPFSRELYIERGDFMEDPPKKFFRLAPGREVRLRYGYFITCTDVVKDEAGEVVELRCTYDPKTRGGQSPDGRKVKGTIHWVSARHAVDAEVRLYEHLFTSERPDEEADFLSTLNPDSLEVVADAKVEPSLADARPGERFQFERLGYFAVDPDSGRDRRCSTARSRSGTHGRRSARAALPAGSRLHTPVVCALPADSTPLLNLLVPPRREYKPVVQHRPRMFLMLVSRLRVEKYIVHPAPGLRGGQQVAAVEVPRGVHAGGRVPVPEHRIVVAYRVAEFVNDEHVPLSVHAFDGVVVGNSGFVAGQARCTGLSPTSQSSACTPGCRTS